MDRNRTRPFALIGVNEDSSLDELRAVQKEKHLNWRSFWDGGGGPIARKWKINGLPALFLIDHKGLVRWHSFGVPDLKQLDDLIEQLVQQAENDGSKQAALSKR